MVRYVSATWGLLATAALVLTALAIPGLVGGFHAAGAGSVSSAPMGFARGPAPASAAHPLAERSSTHPAAGISVNVTITSTYTGTIKPPVVVNYTIGDVTGVPLGPANISVSIAITAGNTLLTNTSEAVLPGVANYSATFDYYHIGGYTLLPTGPYNIQAFATASDPNLGTVTNGSNVATIATMLVFNPSVTFTGAIPVYVSLPIPVNFSVGLNASNSGITASAANETVGLAFEYLTANCVSGCGGPTPTYIPAVVGNTTLPYSANGQYSVSIDSAFLAGIDWGAGTLPTGSYAIVPWVVVASSTDPTIAPRTMQASQSVQFTQTGPSGQLLTPTGGANGTKYYTGSPVQITAFYSGNFVTSANVTVVNQTSKASVFTAGVFSPGNGGHAGVADWTPGAAGLYTISLKVTTPYQAPVFVNTTNVTVLGAAGPSGPGINISYINTTNWHNSTGGGASWFGLSPGAGAAILLVIGLIIGMIVALALGRMMWGPTATAPVQTWTQKTTTTAANECSVCHQSFPTKEALDEHAKSAHGITSS
jgi:hypothetical protein